MQIVWIGVFIFRTTTSTKFGDYIIGKAIKKAKLTFKIKGKTYKAKINSKVKATFKIKKLIRKGKYNAVIKFKGDKYYKKVTKKFKIRIK